MKRVFLISNMYPSKNQEEYGVFVKNFENELKKEVIFTKKALIKGRGRNKFEKLMKYIYFYIEIIFKGIKSKHYDIIYVHYVTHAVLPLVVLNFFKKNKIIYNFHGDDLITNNKVSKLLLEIFKKVLLKNENIKIVVPSTFFKGKAMEILNLKDSERIIISYSGGIKKEFYISNTKKEVDSKKLTLGFVSRVNEEKGIFVLLESLKLLRENITNDFECYIIGDYKKVANTKQKLDYKNIVEKKVKEYKLESNIKILGALKQKNLIEYYQKLNVFIFPTKLEESLGLVGVEAMAAGAFVIASNIGGINEYLKDNETGFLFKTGDSNDLFLKILAYKNLCKNQKNKILINSKKMSKNFLCDNVRTDLLRKIFEK